MQGRRYGELGGGERVGPQSKMFWRAGPRARILLSPPNTSEATTRPQMVAFIAHTSEEADPSRAHVLVVDDDPHVLAILSRILGDAGYLTTRASDGLEALRHVQDDPRAFNAVVSDVLMPRLDGVGLRERLTHVRPSLPVVLLSGYPPPDLASRGIEAPCAILTKPVPPETLVAIVRDCIAGQRPSNS